MTKLDLQDAYLTIPVGPKSKIFFRLFWKGVLYQFTCLPLGSSPSARLFTKTLKPVIAFLRSMGIHLLIFLDDILIMAYSLERAAEHTEIVIRVLESLGFVIKKKKLILKPTSNQGSTLVDSRPCTSKWQGDYSSKSGFSNFLRCFKDQMGSSSSRNQHRRSLERARSPKPYKLLGAGSSISGSQLF